MLYADYVKDVFDDYQRKKAAAAVSARLVHPTTANLREECVALCGERFSVRDQGILKTFFGQIGGDPAACIQAIRKHDVDRFRPLVTFMRTGKTDTHLKNINLLAWLIDYPNRPFSGLSNEPDTAGEDVDSDDTGKNDLPPTTPPVEDQRPNDSVTEPNKKWWQKIYSRKAGITILILLAANVGAYTLWISIKSPTYPPGNEKCMYWADDHYQPVSCTQKIENSLVIALDSQRLNHFKRITSPDTITLNSIGNVWYTKINGNIEFYTSDGFHPIDIRLRLKPITQFIINKYIHPANASK